MTSTANPTSNLTFTIRKAFDLCEIAEYDQAASLLTHPDLESSDPELLFAWGVIASGQGRQEIAKDLLSKAARLLTGARAELARVYLSLCYWRLGESDEALVLLSIEPTGTQARFCCLLVRAIIETERGNYGLALTLLDKADTSELNDAKRGKFHNHRGLALRNLGRHDEAIHEFETASRYWNRAPQLLALAKNNLSRAYSLTGRLDDALASVDTAISLTTNRQLLGQFHDQRAKIFLDHACPDQAKVTSDTAVELLRDTEREDFLSEALTTQRESLLSSPLSHSRKGATPMSVTLDRTDELVNNITREDDAEHAWELLELLHHTSAPDNAVAQHTMRHLFTLTSEFEEEYQRQMAQRFSMPESSSLIEH